MDEKIYQVTKEGLKLLKDELKNREEVLRCKIADTLNEMRDQGDLRENDGYSMAVEEQQINENRIIELKDKIKNALIIKDSNKSVVGIGDTVTLKGEKRITYTVTGEDEANPLEGKISYLSPIGKAIMGKKLGTEICIKTPKGSTEYKIEKIV